MSVLTPIFAGSGGGGGGPVEGTDILSTGETGGVKYLREDGDGTSSWQLVSGWNVNDTTYGNYGHGLTALDSVTVGSGLDNIAIGGNAGTAVTTGDRNILIGTDSGKLINTGIDNTSIGYRALDAATNTTSCVAIGSYALSTMTSGAGNVAIGVSAGAESNATGNVFVGYSAGGTSTGTDNTVIGSSGAIALTNGVRNVVIGTSTRCQNSTQSAVIIGEDAEGDSYSVVIGSRAHTGSSLGGTQHVIIGYSAAQSLTTADNCIVIGSQAAALSATEHKQVVIGDFLSGYGTALSDVDWSGKTLTLQGPGALPAASTNRNAGDLILQGGVAATTGAGVGGDVKLQGGAGGSTGTKGSVILDYATWPAADGTADYVLKTDGAGTLSWVAQGGGGGFTSIIDDETNGNYAIGLNALNSLTLGSGLDNIAIGENAGTLITTGDNNICIGTDAEVNSTSNNNVVVGDDARVNSSGYSVAIGALAGQTYGLGQNCVGIGYGALRSNASDVNNTAVGAYAMYNDGTSDYAVAIGAYAGYSGGGKSDSVIIGNKAANNSSATYSYVRAIIIGHEALQQTTGQQQDAIAIGTNCGTSTTYGYGVHFGNFCSPVRDYGLRYQHNYRSTNLPQPWVDGRLPAWSDTDVSSSNITYTGCSAYPDATTNLSAGDLILQGGVAATTGAGVGGDLILRGGAGGSTGSAGLIIMDNLPTSDPTVAGALWNNSGVLTISAG